MSRHIFGPLAHLGNVAFENHKNKKFQTAEKLYKEILTLNKNHLELKDEIEQSQKHYEKLIDVAADEISNFVEKANTDKVS